MVHPATLARVVTELGGEIHEYSRATDLDTSVTAWWPTPTPILG